MDRWLTIMKNSPSQYNLISIGRWLQDVRSYEQNFSKQMFNHQVTTIQANSRSINNSLPWDDLPDFPLGLRDLPGPGWQTTPNGGHLTLAETGASRAMSSDSRGWRPCATSQVVQMEKILKKV